MKRSTKRRPLPSVIIACMAALFAVGLSGCRNPASGGEGEYSLTLNLGSIIQEAQPERAAARAAVNPSAYSYELLLKGASGEQVHKVSAGSSSTAVTVRVAAGRWDITVKALLGGNPAYEGSGSLQVPEQTRISIQLSLVSYTVTFGSQGGSNVHSETVNSGDTVTEPPAPTRTDYYFGGWFTDDGTFRNRYTFNEAVTDSLTLYAQWTAISYTITYELNGGTNHSSNPATYTIGATPHHPAGTHENRLHL